MTVELLAKHNPEARWHAVDNGDGGATIKDEHGGYVASVQWRGHAALVAEAPTLLAALSDVTAELASLVWELRARGESALADAIEADCLAPALAAVLAAVTRAEA